MSYLDFKPSTCRKCGNLVWDGISATSACQVKLDTKRLNLIEEIQALASGVATYQIHRTAGSFEAKLPVMPSKVCGQLCLVRLQSARLLLEMLMLVLRSQLLQILAALQLLAILPHHRQAVLQAPAHPRQLLFQA